ncbi:MAG TPA: hypothetical protein ENH82_09895 [bacterium]|nr:hypothetical protein [bacterium]
MNIQKNKDYKIKGNSDYFKKKYGTSNPVIRIEDRDIELFSGGWGLQNGNLSCMLFGMRVGKEDINPREVWYGHVEGLGELVDSSELEENG